MTEFAYKAITSTGTVLQGEIQAENKQTAIEELRSQGMTPLVIKEKNYFSLFRLWSVRKAVSQHHIVYFTEQLATMLKAGLPIERALQLSIILSSHVGLKAHLEATLAEVRDGTSFSEALEHRSNFVSKLYISMVRAGETGGNLANSLEYLSSYLSRARDLQQGLVSAMIYPAILLVMAVGSVIALLTFVVPSFAPRLEELGDNMPTITQIVLDGGAFLQNYWWLLIVIIIISIMTSQQVLSKPSSKLRFDNWLLKGGKLSDLLVKMETARFSRTLGSLLTNGVPIIQGLMLSSEVINNTAFLLDIKKISKEVKSGRSLADAISNIDYFPQMALQMLFVGQETGKLGQVLIKMADNYDREIQITINRLLSILVPLLILVMSAIIAIIVISILLAILSVNDLFS